MSLRTASSVSGDVDDVLDRIDQPNAKAVLFFVSPDMKSGNPHLKFASRFPGSVCVGASMIGGWEAGNPIGRGIAAMSLGDDLIEEAWAVSREGARENPQKATREIIGEVKRLLAGRHLDPGRYFGILLVDGLSLGELVMKELTVAKDFSIPIIGGAAADELKFVETLVFHNRLMSGNGIVLLVVHSKVPFFYNHYVHYQPTDREFVITKADPSRRIVWEIEGKPAASFYAELLGLRGPDRIDHSHFAENPLGVMIGSTVYARSPNTVIEGKGLQFYCFIEAGTRMRLLSRGDIIGNARSALEEARSYLGDIQGAVLFNCVLRYLEMKNQNLLEDFGRVFSGTSSVGFNTFGEELFTHHNQTLTALFFGRNT